jgi:antitoxin (DNA-binding transcriptional repressor) of toxin-antitoxin stability system
MDSRVNTVSVEEFALTLAFRMGSKDSQTWSEMTTIEVMAYFSVAEAKAKLSDLIAMAERGDEVIITRNGRPVIDLARHRARGLVLGSGSGDPAINRESLMSDRWWQAMSDEEAEDLLRGR